MPRREYYECLLKVYVKFSQLKSKIIMKYSDKIASVVY